jgi:hypothetical protein
MQLHELTFYVQHDRMNVDRRIADRGGVLGQIKTSDIARLMELFQVCLPQGIDVRLFSSY